MTRDEAERTLKDLPTTRVWCKDCDDWTYLCMIDYGDIFQPDYRIRTDCCEDTHYQNEEPDNELCDRCYSLLRDHDDGECPKRIREE